MPLYLGKKFKQNKKILPYSNEDYEKKNRKEEKGRVL